MVEINIRIPLKKTRQKIKYKKNSDRIHGKRTWKSTKYIEYRKNQSSNALNNESNEKC